MCSNTHSSERPLSAYDVHGPATRRPESHMQLTDPKSLATRKQRALLSQKH